MSSAVRQKIPEQEFRSLVDAARDRHNLSDIVSRYTVLKKRGSNEKVGLCPFHQERTPSFEVNDAKGFYHCHGCGESGDAYRFLRAKAGLSFMQAYEVLAGDAFPDVSPDEMARRKSEDQAITRARINTARSIWESGRLADGTLAETYLRARRITCALPLTIRFGMVPRYFDHETGEVGREYPAVICALQDSADEVTAVQCIYLAPDGRTKLELPQKGKAKLTFGVMGRSAFRIAPACKHIVICEGPEDGMTLRSADPDMPVWVSCGTAALGAIDIPEVVKAITLAGDNNAPGRKAVFAAKRAYLARGLHVDEIFPDPQFKDFNDQLRGARCQ